MIDHPAPTLIEQLAIGALEDEPSTQALIAHCAACDVCADRLAREARLELALGELHVYRAAQQQKSRRVIGILAPVLVFAAAAAILFALRRPSPRAEVRPDPSVAPTFAVGSGALAPSATTPSDADEVIATLRPRFRACYQENLRAGGPTSGKAIMGVRIDPDGKVLDVTVDLNDGFTTEMTMCLVEVLKKGRFTGTGKPETLHVPVTFVAQK